MDDDLSRMVETMGTVLGYHKIFEYIATGKLRIYSDNHIPFEPNQVQSNQLDLKLHPKHKLLIHPGVINEGELHLPPFTSAKILSNEIIHMPEDLMAIPIGRSSYNSMGLLFSGTPIDAGYKGRCRFLLANLSHSSIVLEPGTRICSLVFFRVDSAKPYRGRYQEITNPDLLLSDGT